MVHPAGTRNGGAGKGLETASRPPCSAHVEGASQDSRLLQSPAAGVLATPPTHATEDPSVPLQWGQPTHQCWGMLSERASFYTQVRVKEVLGQPSLGDVTSEASHHKME